MQAICTWRVGSSMIHLNYKKPNMSTKDSYFLPDFFTPKMKQKDTIHLNILEGIVSIFKNS